MRRKRRTTKRGEEGEERGGREREREKREPIDVGAGQVAPLIAPQRVQLCGPPAITAHSAHHLTPRHPSTPLEPRCTPRYPPSRIHRQHTAKHDRHITGRATAAFYLNAPPQRVYTLNAPRSLCNLTWWCREKKSVNERLSATGIRMKIS